MIPYERQETILQILSKQELLKIDELQKLIPDVSISTLRRDLKELEKSNKIEYLFGGAVKLSENNGEVSMRKKVDLNREKKDVIARIAASQIHDGETVYIDSGSTCSLLLREIVSKKITIYTTSTSVFNISQEISAQIILTGGSYNPLISSLSGPLTEECLQMLYFDKSFIGVNGIDIEKGVTTPNISEATKKKLIKSHSRATYLMCDSTKFHKFSNIKAFDLKDVYVVSDKFDKSINTVSDIITDRKK
ncbi:DeoR/GlpR family DNA-binding transcription regulator [Xylocopilactobacillus apis]|uniref:Lactose phosphotransferase system repressor n=1 Tax=Xylocopilactobacillus apis TaxID=2932183 RepID=A0AAU9D0W2_9LACO|nr:DeoR/GlpR family DNA-binding transcription regulator [Xylocopilactobacillus apis]BDR55925.1 DeoR family transcriptional regulator [Xylocopilactobacillus apis]